MNKLNEKNDVFNFNIKKYFLSQMNLDFLLKQIKNFYNFSVDPAYLHITMKSIYDNNINKFNIKDPQLIIHNLNQLSANQIFNNIKQNQNTQQHPQQLVQQNTQQHPQQLVQQNTQQQHPQQLVQQNTQQLAQQNVIENTREILTEVSDIEKEIPQVLDNKIFDEKLIDRIENIVLNFEKISKNSENVENSKSSEKEKVFTHFVTSNLLKKENNFYIYNMHLDNVKGFRLDRFNYNKNIDNITEHNYKFKIYNDNKEKEIVIQFGNYTIIELINEINKLMEDMSIKMELINNKNLIRFYSINNKKIKIIFTSDINKSLGFIDKEYITPNSQFIAENIFSLQFNTIFIISDINEMNHIYYKNFKFMQDLNIEKSVVNNSDVIYFNEKINISNFKFKFVYLLENSSNIDISNTLNMDNFNFKMSFFYE